MINNKYNYIEKIGDGFSSEVYLVSRINTNKMYIMKQINISEMKKPDRVHYYNEINILRKLRHDNITKYYESFIYNKRYLCIIMEHVDNGTLDKYIDVIKKSNNNIDDKLLIKWVYQLSKVMYYLYKNNVVHCDIKPENILITKDFNLKLCDFGLCYIIS